MTAPEAAELVIQAGAIARGGEVFVLDMGEPVRIQELARNMIELAGHQVRSLDHPTGDIEIAEIGLRPGEKLFEELLIGNNPSPTDHPRILKADEAFLPLEALRSKLDSIARLLDADTRVELLDALEDLVPEFHRQAGIADWVYLEAGSGRSILPITRIA
jgi:FlaA1/EpsC-like NDP-sugar epimerase